ncbi:MAG: hypothetical protein GPJ54_15325 [Candidatus Heimdallarchaeota archaeon]|nr:hypothetical protein [Candidatus Heimdallarchaeota archaeon]
MKLSSILILLLFLVLAMTINSSRGTQNIVTDQNDYTITLSDNSKLISQGDSFNLTVELTLNGNDVESAYFAILDPSGLEIVDIGESQIYNGNGNYTLIITANSTNEIVPGNYNSKVTAYHNSEIITSDFTFIVTALDTVAPILNVISPVNLTSVNDTVFEVILEGKDDIFWKDIRIDIGDINVYYLKNTKNYTIELPDLTYNGTYLYLAVWINLPGISNLNASDLSILFRDGSFNEDTFGLTLTGDYIKPIITWISHQPDDEINSKNITLSWSIVDSSLIQSQILKLNNKLFQPGGVGLTTNDRSFNFIIPIPKNEGQILTFHLSVTDIFDNMNTVELRLIYDPIEAENGDLTDNFSFDSKNAISFIYGLIIVSLVGALFYSLKKYSSRETTLLSKKFISLFNEKPTIEFTEFNVLTEYQQEIDEILNEISLSQMSEESVERVNLYLDSMKSRFEYLIFQNMDNQQLRDLINDHYIKWINELKRSS